MSQQMKNSSHSVSKGKKKAKPKPYPEYKPEPMMVDYPPDPMYYGGKEVSNHEPTWID